MLLLNSVMRSSLRKLITFATLLFVLGQSLGVSFHSHAVEHAHDPAKTCSICQAAHTNKGTLTSSATPSLPVFGFSHTLTIPLISETIAFVSHIPPARAPPLV